MSDRARQKVVDAAVHFAHTSQTMLGKPHEERDYEKTAQAELQLIQAAAEYKEAEPTLEAKLEAANRAAHKVARVTRDYALAKDIRMQAHNNYQPFLWSEVVRALDEHEEAERQKGAS